MDYKYCTGLKKVHNEKSGKTFYYLKKFGVWCRISQEDYQDRESWAVWTDTFLTRVKGDLIHNSKVIYFN